MRIRLTFEFNDDARAGLGMILKNPKKPASRTQLVQWITREVDRRTSEITEALRRHRAAIEEAEKAQMKLWSESDGREPGTTPESAPASPGTRNPGHPEAASHEAETKAREVC